MAGLMKSSHHDKDKEKEKEKEKKKDDKDEPSKIVCTHLPRVYVGLEQASAHTGEVPFLVTLSLFQILCVCHSTERHCMIDGVIASSYFLKLILTLVVGVRPRSDQHRKTGSDQEDLIGSQGRGLLGHFSPCGSYSTICK